MILGSVLFVLGFTVVFVSLLMLVSTFGRWVARWENLITQLMGAIIILLGFVFLGWFRPLQKTKRAGVKSRSGLIGAPLLGAAFAIGWTPCIGPTLALIIGLSLDQASAGRGLILGIAYCVGLGVPFILIALGFGWMATATGWVRKHIRAINICSGSLLIIIGAAMVTGLWTKFTYALQALIDGFAVPL